MVSLQDISEKQRDLLTHVRNMVVKLEHVKQSHAEGRDMSVELDEVLSMGKDLKRMLEDDVFVRDAVWLDHSNVSASEDK